MAATPKKARKVIKRLESSTRKGMKTEMAKKNISARERQKAKKGMSKSSKEKVKHAVLHEGAH